MASKERATVPRYAYMASTDFKMLEEQHGYASQFTNHPLYPASNYHKEVTRIQSEWKNRTTVGGGVSMERELEMLQISYNQIEGQHILQIATLNQMFGQVYGHFADILNDFTIGYLSDDLYAHYLSEYDKAVKKNKALGLESWNKEVYNTLIAKQIAELLVKK